MKPYLKWTAISVGSIVAIAHIGVLGHLVRKQPDRVQVPTLIFHAAHHTLLIKLKQVRMVTL